MRPLAPFVAFILLTAIVPAGTSLPVPPIGGSVGPILAVAEPGDATVQGLLAAGYSPCSAGSAPDCFDAVTANDFLTADLTDRDLIFVGTHNGPGPVYNALVARKAELTAWLDRGGSLIALSEPDSGEYAFIPNTNTYGLYMGDTDALDTANLTNYGQGHPALGGVTNASLTGWDPSWKRWIGEAPSYLGAIIEGEIEEDWYGYRYNWSAPIAYAGNWGDGCLLITTLMADRAAAGHHDPARASDAAAFIKAVVDWSLDCRPVPLMPMPYPGFIRIAAGGTQGPVPRVVHSSNIVCDHLREGPPGTFSVECYPPQPVNGVYEYVCIGSVLHNFQSGRANLTGGVDCGSTALASCSTGATGAPPATVGSCWATAGAQIGPFPLRCWARPDTPVSSTWQWQTTCGSTDP